MLAYRSPEHENIGTSPNSMMFGRELNLPVDLLLGRLQVIYLDVTLGLITGDIPGCNIRVYYR
jgi:hypothetical protein